MSDIFFARTIELFAEFASVDAILLGGSLAGDFSDDDSDFDIYVTRIKGRK
ncbi:MAG: hypothetical protein FWC70_02130 [Defluviitaleaceae bacterium]|nr:hypothetical protein [Defluviitaleaceae bacterium]